MKSFDQEYLRVMKAKHRHHLERCGIYRKYYEYFFSEQKINKLSDLPFLPVRFFKDFELKSIAENDLYRTLLSSGTGGKQSKIFLDQHNAYAQQAALVELGQAVLGKKRRQMFVIDTPSIMKGGSSYGARAAGVNGFRIFSSSVQFLLTETGELNKEVLQSLSNITTEQPILFYGFTAPVVEFCTRFKLQQYDIDMTSLNSVLIHGGGWKKLEHLRVSREEYSRLVSESLGVSKVVDYYGMVEQVGSIFFECTHGYFHETKFSKVIIRDPQTLQPLPDGSTGALQILSTLPTSYPGFSILTEDEGVVSEGLCECRAETKKFRVLGRLSESEVRGCSDAV